ncbi:MAG: hypothetical protein PVI75_01830 [Gammaproteobacteria bacterium]|jgi:hypothetical protein
MIWSKILTFSNITSIIAVIISFISILIAGFSTWWQFLRRPKIKGIFSEIAFERQGGGYKPTKLSNIVEPFFILKNIGARSAIVENIRLKFFFDGESFYAYPYLKPAESIVTWDDQKVKRHFVGLILPFNESWKCDLKFKLTNKKDFSNIGNLTGTVLLELKFIKKGWVMVDTNTSNFSFTREEIQIDESWKRKSDFYSKKIFKNFRSNS